eukprot:CAMPEP_0175092518 /NCGR_PEP_ID=MMETSP0086_2-20121207/2505_1 /TAXON_ID=136419 /ORGANISM="Unknown Unknown, Strain D1" /LENGTH=77 /DNA_ID=CAMNT_0016365385 /DNA_START=24 /DNA_END=257 /DNA_ORIENTATION=+
MSSPSSPIENQFESKDQKEEVEGDVDVLVKFSEMALISDDEEDEDYVPGQSEDEDEDDHFEGDSEVEEEEGLVELQE